MAASQIIQWLNLAFSGFSLLLHLMWVNKKARLIFIGIVCMYCLALHMHAAMSAECSSECRNVLRERGALYYKNKKLFFITTLITESSPLVKLSLVCSCKTVGRGPLLAFHGAKNRFSVTTKLQQWKYSLKSSLKNSFKVFWHTRGAGHSSHWMDIQSTHSTYWKTFSGDFGK